MLNLKRLIAAYLILAVIPGPGLCCCALRSTLSGLQTCCNSLSNPSFAADDDQLSNCCAVEVPSESHSCCEAPSADRSPQDVESPDGEQARSAADGAKCLCHCSGSAKKLFVSNAKANHASAETLNPIDSWKLPVFATSFVLNAGSSSFNHRWSSIQRPSSLSGRDLLLAYQILRC